MPQLSLYLDEPTMEMLREKSSRAHQSMSRYVTGLIRESGEGRGWPSGYWDNVSDVCIEIMRGHLPRAQEIMRKSSPDLFGVPAIVEAELLYGAENSNNPEEGRYFVESLLSPLHIIPFDSRCAACYARVRADLKRRGCIIGPNDLLIAATALAHGATLVSNNTRVFRRVEGLLLELWAEVDF